MSNTRVHCLCHAPTQGMCCTRTAILGQGRVSKNNSGKKESDKDECMTQTKTDEAKKRRRAVGGSFGQNVEERRTGTEGGQERDGEGGRKCERGKETKTE